MLPSGNVLAHSHTEVCLVFSLANCAEFQSLGSELVVSTEKAVWRIYFAFVRQERISLILCELLLILNW